jgi:hypothetical protein
MYSQAIEDFLVSLHHYANAEDMDNMEDVLDHLEKECLPNSFYKDIKRMVKQNHVNFEEVLEEVEDADENNILSKQIERVRDGFVRLVDQGNA